MSTVKFKSICKIYDQTEKKSKDNSQKKVQAVRDFSLDIKNKEFIVLVGPSGCGKTTTLRMLAGLEEISSGELFIDDVKVNDIPPKDRDIAMVFQNYALYPHLTVYDNIAFSLKMRKMEKNEIDQSVRNAAGILGLDELLKRKPKELSGGQRQRVAIGRAIVRNPKVLLMDEPLSNLDAKLRNQMRTEIIKLRKSIDTTFVYVTHDQIEAMTLGDRIVVMKDGVIQQIGTPQEVFERPKNKFVAGFIGTPQMNLIEGCKIEQVGEQYYLHLGDNIVPLPCEYKNSVVNISKDQATYTLGIRPEDVIISEDGIPVQIEVAEMMGSEYHLHMKLGDHEIICVEKVSKIRDVEALKRDRVHISFNNRWHLFDDVTGERIE